MKKDLYDPIDRSPLPPAAGMVTPYRIILQSEQQIRAHMRSRQIRRFAPHKTAITRRGPTAPVKLAHQSGLIRWGGISVLDYGKGKSNDCQFVQTQGGICYIYDFTFCPLSADPPTHTPQERIRPITPHHPQTLFDVVICVYVLNVITPQERKIVAETVVRLLKPHGQAIVGVRISNPSRRTGGRSRMGSSPHGAPSRRSSIGSSKEKIGCVLSSRTPPSARWGAGAGL